MSNQYYVEIRGANSAAARKEELLEALERGISERGPVEHSSVELVAGRPTARFKFNAGSHSEAESLVTRALLHAREFSVEAGVVLELSKASA